MSVQRPKDQYVEVGDIRTRYWALGHGNNSVILLHGLGGYIENWEENVTALAQGHRVYALDLVGFGRSDKPQVTYSIPYLAKFVENFMIVLGVERATLIGESMGGAIALRFALQSPDQVEKMVLAASAGLGKEISTFLRVMSLPILGELIGRPSRQGSAQLIRQLFHNQDLITDQGIEEDFEMSSLPGAQQSLFRALRSMVNVWGVRSDAYRPIFDHLDEIEVPTLIIWGAQDQILPVSHAHRAGKRLPNAQIHVFEKCGHLPNIELAEDFNTLVLDFLSDK